MYSNLSLKQGMETKPCQKCGTAARYASGRCKKCQSDHIKQYRKRQRGDYAIQTPQMEAGLGIAANEYDPDVPLLPEIRLVDVLGSSKERLDYAIRRLDNVMRQLQNQAKQLDRFLASATNGTDIRFYTTQKRKLLQVNMRLNERLAKDLYAYDELRLNRGDKETPVTIIVAEAPREFVEGRVTIEAFAATVSPDREATR